APLVSRPAFSIVATPHYFPYARQIDLERWADSIGPDSQFKEGGPSPLCEGRMPANLSMPRPGSGVPAFDADDETMVAMVGRAAGGECPAPVARPHSTTFMPDCCSNE